MTKRISWLTLMAVGLLLPLTSSAWSEDAATPGHLSPEVRAFLIAHYKSSFDAKAEAENPARVNFADLPLADGRTDVVVYMTGGGFCGSGGCTMMVLEPKDGAFKIIARTTVTQTPIRRLSTSSHGYPDIGVWVQGGGVQPSYEAQLRFNGKVYPSNPTMVPAVKTHTEGQIVIGSEQGELLYK